MKQTRRTSALARLEKQLASGVKPSKVSPGAKEPLTEHDVKRIHREIVTLKSRT